MEMDKMKKAAGNWDIFVKFIDKFYGVIAWVAVAVGAVIMIFGEHIMTEGALSLELGYLTLYLAEGAQVDFRMMKTALGAGLMICGVIFLLVSRGAKLLRGILASMKEGRPFEPDAPARLRKIAWLALAGGALLHVAVFLIEGVMIRACSVEQIFSSPYIAGVEYTFTMDFGFVWLACAILMLSYVFEYGQKLQLESDETL